MAPENTRPFGNIIPFILLPIAEWKECGLLGIERIPGAIIDIDFVVLLPHFRPRDGTLENHCFQILKYVRVYE